MRKIKNKDKIKHHQAPTTTVGKTKQNKTNFKKDNSSVGETMEQTKSSFTNGWNVFRIKRLQYLLNLSTLSL